MMDENKPKMAVTGGSSLLAIFAVLCLVVFAVLGIATAQADRRLFQSLEDEAVRYYQADLEANAILGQLRAGKETEAVLVSEADGKEYAYGVPVSDVQGLQCRVKVYGDGRYEVLEWRLARTVDWEGNFDTPVFTD